MSKYDHLYSNGCPGDKDMYIMLYPNTNNEDDNVQSNVEITNALHDALEDIYYDSQITYYEIKRFKADTYTHPGCRTDTRDNLSSDFDSWLKDGNKNGTGDDLHNIRGAHVLVHDGDCVQSLAGGEVNNNCGETAFSVGSKAWTPVCLGNAKKKCSAIQETLHQFINEDDSDVQKLLGSSSDEHVLGKINDRAQATPMMTYHGDESSKRQEGDCQGINQKPSGYKPQITRCTMEGIGRTAEDGCVIQGTEGCQ